MQFSTNPQCSSSEAVDVKLNQPFFYSNSIKKDIVLLVLYISLTLWSMQGENFVLFYLKMLFKE